MNYHCRLLMSLLIALVPSFFIKGMGNVPAEWQTSEKHCFLYAAIRKGSCEGIEELIKNCENIDLATMRGNTLLHLAAFYGRGTIIKLLLNKGASPTKKNQDGFLAYEFAYGACRDWLDAIRNAQLLQLNWDFERENALLEEFIETLALLRLKSDARAMQKEI